MVNWSKFKSLFVEVEESETKPSSNKNNEIVPPATSVPQSVPTVQIDPSQGIPNQTIIDNLSKAISDANIQGFDYFEFAQVLDKLSSTLPSEQLRFETAFSTAAVMGVTKAKLLETAAYYLTVLDSEAKKFSDMVAEQLKATVTDKEASIQNIEQVIKEKSEAITRLTQEINSLTKEKTTILNEMSQNKINIQKIQNDFASCLKVFVDKINNDTLKINQYILD